MGEDAENSNPRQLPAEKYNGAATRTAAVTFNAFEAPRDPAVLFLGTGPKEVKTGAQADSGTFVFVTPLLTTAEGGRSPGAR